MKDCFICGETKDSLNPHSIASCFTPKFNIGKEKFYLCMICEILLGNKAPDDLINLFGDPCKLNVFRSTKKVLELLAQNAPDIIISHQIGVLIASAVRNNQWDFIRQSIFKRNYNESLSDTESCFSEKQLVDIITDAELAKPRSH